MEESSYKIQFERTFLLQKLPADFDRSAEHLQIFEKYIENTRLCLRMIRAPKTNRYAYVLEQKFPRRDNDLSVSNVARISLSRAEYEAFPHSEARAANGNERGRSTELRFNRYNYDLRGRRVEIDIHLGPNIRGLILARLSFDSEEEMRGCDPPELAVLEVTQNASFGGRDLTGLTLSDVEAECLKRENDRS